MLNRWILSVLIVIAAATTLPAIAQSVTTFTVTNNGASDYVFAGLGNDPTLTLMRGRTYVFNVNANGHPFFIATQGSDNTAPHFTDGVTGNDVQIGALTFVVPASAPATLFYQCSFHDAMSGTLLIESPPVPALGTAAVLSLSALVLFAGYLLRRKKTSA